jgi:hypothetical protein
MNMNIGRKKTLLLKKQEKLEGKKVISIEDKITNT